MSVEQITTEIKDRLEAVYGVSLKGIVLYGSAARGMQSNDSDIDILVLLDRPVDLGKDLETIIDAVYPLQLATPYPLHDHIMPLFTRCPPSLSWKETLFPNTQP